jgi:hypothetical protein
VGVFMARFRTIDPNGRFPKILVSMLFLSMLLHSSTAQTPPKPAATRGPMLGEGFIDIETPEFILSLVRSSQTVAALKPKGANGFDFTPGDLLIERSNDGYFHLGDLTLRLRTGHFSTWKNYSTATSRHPVTALPTSRHVLAAADLAPTLPADLPLQVTRKWALEDSRLVLRFALKNKTKETVEVGALGIPMIFNNVLNDRSLDEAHAKCSFYDPYIGMNAGYLQVTRLSGQGPALLVVPDGITSFEAYNPILDKPGSWGSTPIFTDPTPRGITFEGFYEWMVSSKAYAENEWKNAQPWNLPTGITLKPGESKTYGLKFLTSNSVRHIERTLAANHRPVAIGIPGYVLPMDIEGRLFLNYPKGIRSMNVEPDGALAIHNDGIARDGSKAFTLTGKTWGRSRLTVIYQDGLAQTIHYFVTKPEIEVVADMGHFLTTKQWYIDPNDPFHRSPSAMPYDRETNQIVMQDSRTWIAGLGDEGGGGAWISAIMKQLTEPNKEELEKLQQFVDGVLWGGLQHKDGPTKFGVRKSLFYYQPDQMPAGYYRSDFDWSTWTSWNREHAERIDRSYDYPHVAAADWVFYRLARNHQGLVTNHPWDWYLKNAYETSVAMTKYAGEYAIFGQMEGTIFLQIMDDLRREGMTIEAADLEAKMRVRAERWKGEAYPFGSEMPWDSTGQEEVYAWTKYFGYHDKADVTLNAILGYDPTIPHWGYNGSARRYWDFIFAAKDRRLERQLHHYGSSLNAIPVLSEYREHPEDLYLLRVGYGGTMGALTDIDQEGFASAAFHAFPDMLKHDPITGDYGPNFFGHAWNTATYVVQTPAFGWVAFGGNIKDQAGVIHITPRDSYRSRVFLASLGLWLTLDAGNFDAIELNPKSGIVRVGLAAMSDFTPVARLRVEHPAKVEGVSSYAPLRPLKSERDAYVVPLTKGTTWVELGGNQPR